MDVGCLFVSSTVASYNITLTTDNSILSQLYAVACNEGT